MPPVDGDVARRGAVRQALARCGCMRCLRVVLVNRIFGKTRGKWRVDLRDSRHARVAGGKRGAGDLLARSQRASPWYHPPAARFLSFLPWGRLDRPLAGFLFAEAAGGRTGARGWMPLGAVSSNSPPSPRALGALVVARGRSWRSRSPTRVARDLVPPTSRRATTTRALLSPGRGRPAAGGARLERPRRQPSGHAWPRRPRLPMRAEPAASRPGRQVVPFGPAIAARHG